MVLEFIEGMEELFLHTLFAGQDLYVIHQQHTRFGFGDCHKVPHTLAQSAPDDAPGAWFVQILSRTTYISCM